MKHLIAKGPSGRFIVEVKLEQQDKGPRLSICGERYDLRLREPWSVGQNIADLRSIPDSELAPDWPRERVEQLVSIWERWHLNDLRAGCEHQRALGWQSCSGNNPACPIPVYHGGVWDYNSGKGGVYVETANGRTVRYWYPQGSTTAVYCIDALSQKCPECGYAYGSAWLYEALPEDVLAFVRPLVQA